MVPGPSGLLVGLGLSFVVFRVFWIARIGMQHQPPFAIALSHCFFAGKVVNIARDGPEAMQQS